MTQMFDEEFYKILYKTTLDLINSDNIDSDKKLRINCNIESLILQIEEIEDIKLKKKYLEELKVFNKEIKVEEKKIEEMDGDMLIFSRKLREKAQEFYDKLNRDKDVLDEGIGGFEKNLAVIGSNMYKITKKKDISVGSIFLGLIFVFLIMYFLVSIF